MQQPLVSVIIPNYNYARFLPQRINSVLSQTYREIELIILDDCSTDGSRDIIDSYRNEERVKHVVFNGQNNGSTFRQWNKGFGLAAGNFIWVAECDDYAEPDFLEKIMAVMCRDEDIKIGFSNSYWETPDGTFINKDYTIKERLKVYDGRSFVRRHLLKENFIYNASMAVFRRDALPWVDAEAYQFRSCGDKLFWSSIAETGKVAFVCEPLNHFRIHAGKVTSGSLADGTLFREEHLFFLKNIQKRYITWRNRWEVVSYFVRYVRRSRNLFLSDAVYEDCLCLWENEKDYRNAALPFGYRVICFMVGIILKEDW